MDVDCGDQICYGTRYFCYPWKNSSQQLLGEKFKGILVSDRFSSYNYLSSMSGCRKAVPKDNPYLSPWLSKVVPKDNPIVSLGKRHPREVKGREGRIVNLPRLSTRAASRRQ